MTLSFPPSMGICAPVVTENLSPTSSATTAATWSEVTSVPSRFRRLYDSTSMLYCAARSAINPSFQMPVSNTASGLTMLTRMPSGAHSSAATLANWVRAALEAE